MTAQAAGRSSPHPATTGKEGMSIAACSQYTIMYLCIRASRAHAALTIPFDLSATGQAACLSHSVANPWEPSQRDLPISKIQGDPSGGAGEAGLAVESCGGFGLNLRHAGSSVRKPAAWRSIRHLDQRGRHIANMIWAGQRSKQAQRRFHDLKSREQAASLAAGSTNS